MRLFVVISAIIILGLAGLFVYAYDLLYQSWIEHNIIYFFDDIARRANAASSVSQEACLVDSSTTERKCDAYSATKLQICAKGQATPAYKILPAGLLGIKIEIATTGNTEIIHSVLKDASFYDPLRAKLGSISETVSCDGFYIHVLEVR